MMRLVLLSAVLLMMAAGGAASADTWTSDSNIVDGLVDVGFYSKPSVFNMSSTWYLVAGEGAYNEWNGYNWASSTWTVNNGIISGLGAMESSTPTVFQKDGTWYLITGKYHGDFHGYSWTGSTWTVNNGIISGIVNPGDNPTPTVFQKDSTWYLIIGEDTGVFNGYNWSGSAWQSDTEIISGLADVGTRSAPTVFQKDSTWYLITGRFDGNFDGYNWTGSAWQSDDDIVTGLPDVGWDSAPTIFYKDETWYLVSGGYDGVFNGYNITIHSAGTPTSLTHTKGKFWVNHTWDEGTGEYDTDSYNVSINETWHNATTNTYYNNTLTVYGDWSNITVYAYNNTYGLSAPVSEDVQLPYPIPATPSGAGSTWDYYWVNHTWTAGGSYGIWCGATDSYNVTINETWYNGTTNTYYNNTGLSPHAWSNASIYAFNDTAGINETYIYQNVQMANRDITITNTSDQNVNEGENVYVDYDATDPDSDTPTFSCNRTDLFTDFDTANGTGNWSAVAGTYYADFGVTDGYGSTSNYTMTIIANADPTNLTHIKGKFWVNHTWDEGSGDVTDSYNVSINETWHNATTNTYYNNTLTVYGDWSNITVYAYNNDTYVLSNPISEDVQLPYPIPAAPMNIAHTTGCHWVNHTWTEGGSYGIWCGDTDSYNVSLNSVWHNGTTNAYYNDTGIPPLGWSNISVYAFNESAGIINDTNIYQNIQISRCPSSCSFAFYDPFHYYGVHEDKVAGVGGWLPCDDNWYVHSIYGVNFYSVGAEDNIVYGTYDSVTGDYTSCYHGIGATEDCEIIYVHADVLVDDSHTRGLVYVGAPFYDCIDPGNPTHEIIGFSADEYLGYTRIWALGNPGTYPDAVLAQWGEWISVSLAYDLSTKEYVYVDVIDSSTTHTRNDLSTVYTSQTRDLSNVTMLFGIAGGWGNCYADNVYVSSLEYAPSSTHIILKDASGNPITNAQVSIYDTAIDTYSQKWENDANGVIPLSSGAPIEVQVSVRTFDGVYTRQFNINDTGDVVDWTIPIWYNVDIYPVDQAAMPLLNVFAGLAEYTPLNPGAFWGMDLSDRGSVAVGGCSGFAMCDIIAEKDGYADYKVEALNWTSKSALVKDYRHNIVMEEE